MSEIQDEPAFNKPNQLFLTPAEHENLLALYRKVGTARAQQQYKHVVQKLFNEYEDYFKGLCKKYKLNPVITTFTFDKGEAVRTQLAPSKPKETRYHFCPECNRKVRSCPHDQAQQDKMEEV